MTAARKAWARYLSMYRPAWMTVVLTSLASTIQAGLGLPIAWLLRRLFDSQQAEGVQTAILLALVAVLYLAGDALLMFSVRRNLGLVKPVARQLREELFETAMLASRSTAQSHSVGALHSALLQDVERVDTMSASLLCRFLPSLLSVVVLFAVLAILSLSLFVVAIIVLPLGWIVTAGFRRKVRARIAAFDASQDAYNASSIGLLQRLDLTRAHGAEKAELARHAVMTGDLADKGWLVASSTNALYVLHNQLAIFTAIAVLFAGHRLIADGTISLGTLLAFYIVLAMTRGHLTSIATAVPAMISGHAALQRVVPMLDSEAGPPYSGTKEIDFRGHVVLADVTFSYGGEAVLREVSLDVPAGTITGITGPNGAGKTTIARLMLGLDRPSSGKVLAEGVPFDQLSMHALRQRMAFAAQDPVVFAASLRENLTFGLGRAVEDDELERVLQLAGADFLDQLDHGLKSWLGDEGVRLSGGQRQRLSIARAVLRRPALLILDEMSNHLGSREALVVLSRIEAHCHGAAMVIISHDPDLLARADRRWRLGPDGRIERDV